MKLIRWYHHPKIFPWITQFTLIEWLVWILVSGLVWFTWGG